MVALEAVHASNALITSTLPAGLVAVFVGATSGIGEATLKAFVSVAVRPRVHIIARSSTKGARIVAECQELCPEGHFDLIEADCSLMRDTDAAATRILAKETVLNLLCMSQGDPAFDRAPTPEGLNSFLAALYYSRTLLAHRLLPLLRAAGAAPAPRNLARVLCIAGGASEGALVAADLRAQHVPLAGLKAHTSTLLTLTLEALARAAGPRVVLVHAYPGFVRTPLQDRMGERGAALLAAAREAGTPMVPLPEAGARHLYVCTSAAYGGVGVPRHGGAGRTRGVDGRPDGLAVFSIDQTGESASEGVVELLREYREAGWVERCDQLWKEDVERAIGQKLY